MDIILAAVAISISFYDLFGEDMFGNLAISYRNLEFIQLGVLTIFLIEIVVFRLIE